MEKRYTFDPIKFTLNEIVETESVAKYDISSGMYKIRIDHAMLKQSQSSNACAVSFKVSVLKDIDNNEYDFTRSMDIWFLKSDGTASDYGAKKIASLFYLLGLPLEISADIFKEGEVKVSRFSEDEGKYVDITEKAMVIKELTNKTIWALIAIKYEDYNGNTIKRYDLNSFYNDSLKSVTEIKNEVVQASSYIGRLEYAKKTEEQTFKKYNQSTSNYPMPKGGVTTLDEVLKETPPPPAKDTTHTPPPTNPMDTGLSPASHDPYRDEIPF